MWLLTTEKPIEFHTWQNQGTQKSIPNVFPTKPLLPSDIPQKNSCSLSLIEYF